MIRKVYNILKNYPGWKTRKKLIVFSVDDYGSIRIDSKKSRDILNARYPRTVNRFDQFDALETNEDLEALFETLSRYKDKNGRKAIFTPFSLTRNIDFKKLSNNGYSEYPSETLPETYNRLYLSGKREYHGVMRLWKEAIGEGIFLPQYHGREHFNILLFQKLLDQKDPMLIESLKLNSCISLKLKGSVDITSAYNIEEAKESDVFKSVINEGIEDFYRIFGYYPIEFMPPTSMISNKTLKLMDKSHIKFVGRALIHNSPLGSGRYRKSLNYLGKKINKDLYTIVRNVVFEPNDNRGFDWVNYALEQIKAAFLFNKPAIISSHRVNFSGSIDEANRKAGLASLDNLLGKITKKWPDAEFLSSGELCRMIFSDIERV